ncbi:MMPL family transporter [Paenibacillus pinisoli]|uniref:MMPL family transporter n=1 Tax=Paenibacillus pinisoli TaxID=1276110 RepID=A0A3A6PWE1_9BACL|nr:MMPL family transporter [Paenibacillus pinisoli]RJX39723.1 MMPL family transporter [Paenibacillus pinisoli]
MHSFLATLARFASSRKGSVWIIVLWLALAAGLSALAPGAKEHAISSTEDSIRLHTPSAIARQLAEQHFPSDDGLPALLVFHADTAITEQQQSAIEQISQWLSSDQKPEHLSGAMPYHLFPPEVQEQLYSEDGSTLLLSAVLKKGSDSKAISAALEEIRSYADSVGLHGMRMETTGPAGIAADTTKLFQNADMVLMLATVVLILVLLVLIYRSPLLALLPLVIAGVVYAVVDRVIGIAAASGSIVVDKQAISIMMILLFAVLTDYCLFVVSRYREELARLGSKHDAMKAAMLGVGEAILFSGGTVLLAVITLFAAVFQPYHYFAPVFAIAMVIMLLGGLTLIPAVFTLAGRAAFWPFKPKLAPVQQHRAGLWTRIGRLVTKRPAVVSAAVGGLMLLAAVNATGIQFSFNLLKSFPNELSSRQGFELLEEHFPQGRLAPVSVLLESDGELQLTETLRGSLSQLAERMKSMDGVESISPSPEAIASADGSASPPRGFLSADGKAVKLELTLAEHPYEGEALAALKQLRDSSDQLLRDSGFSPGSAKLHYAGATAQQLDVRDMNQRDMVVVFSLVTGLIAIMLIFQARSILIALTMMVTMLLSYAASFGIGWALLHNLLGYDAISYRLPLYAFVFSIALGVDYNIMLVSRIAEEARKRSWREAVMTGVSRTGGVISSAGIILAATFCVLMTQPLQELFLFGLIMAIGILLDTFIVRGMLLPSLLVLLERWLPRYRPLPHARQQDYLNRT